MTDKQYGFWLGTIFSSLPGGYGVWGLLVGIQQERIGPAVLGLVFLFAAYGIYTGIANAAEKRP